MLRSLSIALLLIFSEPAAEAQMAIGRLRGSIAYNWPSTPFSGWVAYLDISSGRLQPVVTPPLAQGACSKGVVQLQTTIAFARQQGTLVAINANLGDSRTRYVSGACGTPYGLLVGGATLINGAETSGSPALVFTSNTDATIGFASSAGQATNAVAGWAGGVGTLLVVPTVPPSPGTNTLPAPWTIAPRIGTGITLDGKTLILVMIDGCEPTAGLQNPDFGNVMIGLGANAAINLDGGGSSTFTFTPGSASLTTPPALSALLKAAAAPSAAANNLSFGVKSLPLDQPWTSVPPCAPLANYRAIYANLGFALAGPKRGF